MRKRSYVIGGIIAGVLLVICLCVWFSLFRSAKDSQVKDLTFSAVPLDAIAVLHCTDFEGLSGALADTSGYIPKVLYSQTGMDFFLPFLDKYADNGREDLMNAECLCSLHDAGKNTMSLLFCMALSPTYNSDIKDDLKKTLGVNGKDYHGQTIYSFDIEGKRLYLSFMKGFLLSSASSVVLEASIRHLETGGSICNDAGFEDVLSRSSLNKPYRLFIRQNRMAQIFSVFLGRQVQKYSSFLARQASWIALEGDLDKSALDMKGIVLADAGEGQYLNILSRQNPEQIGAWDIFPATTLAMLALDFSDYDAFLEDYENFLEIHKRKDRYNNGIDAIEKRLNIDLRQWFKELYPNEVALACMPFEGHIEWITVIRSHFVEQARLQFALLHKQSSVGINDNPVPDAVASLFGPVFAWSKSSKYCFINNYIVMGSEEVLTFLQQQALNGKIFSLHDNIRHSPAKGKLLEQAGITVVLQPSVQQDSVWAFVDRRYKDSLKRLEALNTRYEAVQFHSLEGNIYAGAFVYGGRMLPPPYVRPMHEDIDGNIYAPDTLVHRCPPFNLYNHHTKGIDVMSQKPSPDFLIRSIDSRNRLMWKLKATGPVCDTVMQIDFLKNNKLQSLFAVGATLHLLDRTGKEVAPYPLSFASEIDYGPYVFDVNSDKEYQMFLVHKDGVIRRYNKEGKIVASWQEYLVPGYMTGHLKSMNFDGRRYWVVYASLQTAFLDDTGAPVATLNNDWSLSPDTPLEDLGKGVVSATALNGKPVKFSLITGERLRK